MTKNLIIALFTLISTISSAKNNNALKFLGIPIDGSEAQLIAQLKSKGFEKEYQMDDYVTGMFNGEEVSIFLSTNHGLVDRVKVVYPYCSERNDVRVKYNLLLSRFNRNAKYVCVNPRTEVPATEDIYQQLRNNTKYYDAVYFSLAPEINAEQWVEEFKQEYLGNYNRTLEGLSYEEMEEALFCLPGKIADAVNGVVWFTIVENHYININYVNLSNRPRGEDL